MKPLLVACVYALIVELFIHRSMNLNQVKKVVVSSAVTSATLLIIVAGASCFGRLLTLENIPPKITEAVISTIQSPWVFLLAMNGLLLIVGMFMDIISATLILGPVFLPMLSAVQYRPAAFRPAYDRQPGHRLLYPACGGQPVYYRRYGQQRPGLGDQSVFTVSGHPDQLCSC